MFGDGAECQHREEGQRCENIDDKYQNDGKTQGIRMKGARRFVDKPLFISDPAIASCNVIVR